MPKRLNQEEVKDLFQKYGYTLPNDFVYRNNKTKIRVVDEQTGKRVSLSLITLKNKINRGRSEYDFPNRVDLPVNGDEHIPKESYQRFAEKQHKTFQNKPAEYQRDVHSKTNQYIKQILRQKNFTINFPDDAEKDLNALAIALKQSMPKLSNKNIRLTITDSYNHTDYETINPNTIDLFESFANDDFNRAITTSEDELLFTVVGVKTIKFDFVTPQKGGRINPGYFPFLNKSNIDLSKYGIFTELEDKRRRKPCILQAIKSSNILTTDQYKLLKSFVKTRTMPQTELKRIAETFDIHIYCQILYLEKDSLSHVDFNTNASKTLKLIIIYDHYIYNEDTNVTSFYINNYDEINKDTRFINHPRKTLLQKYDDKRYAFNKSGISISALIKLMIKNNLLTPIENYSYLPLPKQITTNYACNEASRLITIPDKKLNTFKTKVQQTQHFFGYKPETKDIENDLQDIQNVVDRLPLRHHIDVSLYYKFSELMQKIMYEYGCFDDVYELTGLNAKQLREQCIFPKSSLINHSYPFYSNEKLYYIDFNGAYMSCIKSIPSGLPNPDNTFNNSNTKIKDLIEQLYQYRIEAKHSNKTRLEKTLKFIMTSCWGYSIRRPKLIKRKYIQNIDKHIETYSPYIFKYSYNKDNVSGFVETVNPLVMNYTYPQFALNVLTEYNNKVNEIKSLVTVIYQNIDAFLISESDFNKLKALGYIGSSLGQFKVEHIFTEIYIKSSKQYIGKLDNNQYFFHTSPNTKINLQSYSNPIEAYKSLTN